MYHAIIRRRVRKLFEESLSQARWEEALSGAAEDIHHVFPGDHALGGERHSRAAMARWFERLGRLLPGLEFEVLRVASRGWPWSTWVAVEWIDRIPSDAGEPYENEGAHWIHLRWGKATYIHAYLDTQRLEETCERLAAQGVEEAAAEPITD